MARSAADMGRSRLLAPWLATSIALGALGAACGAGEPPPTYLVPGAVPAGLERVLADDDRVDPSVVAETPAYVLARREAGGALVDVVRVVVYPEGTQVGVDAGDEARRETVELAPGRTAVLVARRVEDDVRLSFPLPGRVAVVFARGPWTRDGTTAVGVLTAVAAGLVPEGAGVGFADLPAGYEVLVRPGDERAPFRTTVTSYVDRADTRRTLSIVVTQPAPAAQLYDQSPDPMRATSIRGRPGYVTVTTAQRRPGVLDTVSLAWFEAPGVLVRVRGEVGEDVLRSVAEGLLVTDRAGWQAATRTAP